jgi:hypothetical protein
MNSIKKCFTGLIKQSCLEIKFSKRHARPSSVRTGGDRFSDQMASPRISQKCLIPAEGPWDRVAVDTIVPLTINRYIVVFIDYLTNGPEDFVVPDITAKTIARLIFVETIIYKKEGLFFFILH